MLNNIGLPGLLLIAVVVLVLFGRGKISSLMGEVGKGITAFKKGVSESTGEIESASPETPPRDVTPPHVNPPQVNPQPGKDRV
ncbi:MAG: twin-arginine translocase TatA/TatE family subunit [Defluviimonas sp.]|nr:twin-arginine translocase TatA/TatE family subunit [Defluviimonas sp.]